MVIEVTFHVVTAANRLGEAVVRYFSGDINVQPASCGSYVLMEDDKSWLARQCRRWDLSRGRWSRSNVRSNKAGERLYNHAAWIKRAFHWNLVTGQNNFCCDDSGAPPSSGDFWKVFVR